MSIQSQVKNMKLLGELLSNDLGYIFGERESGPNGAKKQFHTTGSAFLRALGKDLRLSEQKVYVNKAGIACSGEVYLRGMWATSGVKIELSQSCVGDEVLHFWPIENMKDTRTGRRQSITLAEFRKADYTNLVLKLLGIEEVSHERVAA